jgi:hypothetical protein
MSDVDEAREKLTSLLDKALDVFAYALDTNNVEEVPLRERIAVAQDVFDRAGLSKKTVVETQVLQLPPAALLAAVQGIGALFGVEGDFSALRNVTHTSDADESANAPSADAQAVILPNKRLSGRRPRDEDFASPVDAIRAQREDLLQAVAKRSMDESSSGPAKQRRMANKPLPKALLDKLQGKDV